jgi:hypothetical protein
MDAALADGLPGADLGGGECDAVRPSLRGRHTLVFGAVGGEDRLRRTN